MAGPGVEVEAIAARAGMGTTEAMTVCSPAPTTTATDQMRRDAVEQVMRVCDDDVALLVLEAAAPGTPDAAAAVGRLLTSYPVPLVSGCPLISFVTGAPVDAQWRSAYPAREPSLYTHLQFLRQLYGPAADASDEYHELEILRGRAQQDMPDSF